MDSEKIRKFFEEYKDDSRPVFVEGNGEEIESVQLIREIMTNREHIGTYYLIKTKNKKSE